MTLSFVDVNTDELGEVLWSSFMSARLVHEQELRETTPRPEWNNQDAATKELWNYFAARLIALYGK